MYRREHRHQLSFEDFYLPFGGKLLERCSTAWLCRQQNPGPRAQQNAAITTEVHAVFDRHRGFYGA